MSRLIWKLFEDSRLHVLPAGYQLNSRPGIKSETSRCICRYILWYIWCHNLIDDVDCIICQSICTSSYISACLLTQPAKLHSRKLTRETFVNRKWLKKSRILSQIKFEWIWRTTLANIVLFAYIGIQSDWCIREFQDDNIKLAIMIVLLPLHGND